jgi:hypothetical protein
VSGDLALLQAATQNKVKAMTDIGSVRIVFPWL